MRARPSTAEGPPSTLQAAERPSIGLVVAAYQAERYIDQALASVAAQTRMLDQIIVVDDASTDETVNCAQRWAGLLPLEVLSLCRNGGVARARNAGAARLATDLITFLDGDDVLLPDHLISLADVHARHGGIASPRALFWTPGQHATPYQRRLRGFRPPRRHRLRRLVRRNYVFVASMLAREAFNAVEGFTEGDRDQDVTADWDLWLRLVAAGAPVSLAPRPTVLYRVLPGSMADDPRHLLRCEIAQLERSRPYLPPQITGAIDGAVAGRRAELATIELVAERRRMALVMSVAARGGGDWRNRSRAVAYALAPTQARRHLRRRGTW